MNVPITFVEKIDPWGSPPASAQWDEEHKHLLFMCPCGCGAFVRLPVNHSNGWNWNGNLEKPTLTPSILQVNCKWHGFLTDGVFVEC